mmetsp:Transcript_63693/g.136907  ORF Transcript_63693/g.136907 Transcript_63693/m.136907 type:complete len:227 (-) Transcript_63693:3013-3693(-)
MAPLRADPVVTQLERTEGVVLQEGGCDCAAAAVLCAVWQLARGCCRFKEAHVQLHQTDVPPQRLPEGLDPCRSDTAGRHAELLQRTVGRDGACKRLRPAIVETVQAHGQGLKASALGPEEASELPSSGLREAIGIEVEVPQATVGAQRMHEYLSTRVQETAEGDIQDLKTVVHSQHLSEVPRTIDTQWIPLQPELPNLVVALEDLAERCQALTSQTIPSDVPSSEL